MFVFDIATAILELQTAGTSQRSKRKRALITRLILLCVEYVEKMYSSDCSWSPINGFLYPPPPPPPPRGRLLKFVLYIVVEKKKGWRKRTSNMR